MPRIKSKDVSWAKSEMMGAGKILRSEENLLKSELIASDDGFPNRECSDSVNGSAIKRKDCKPAMSIFEALSEELDLPLNESSDPPCKKVKLDLTSPCSGENSPSDTFFSPQSSIVCSQDSNSEKSTELETNPAGKHDNDVALNDADIETNGATESSAGSEKVGGSGIDNQVQSHETQVDVDEKEMAEVAAEDKIEEDAGSKKEESESDCDQKKTYEEAVSHIGVPSNAVVDESTEKAKEPLNLLEKLPKDTFTNATAIDETETSEAAFLSCDEIEEQTAANSRILTTEEPSELNENVSEVSSIVSEASEIVNNVSSEVQRDVMHSSNEAETVGPSNQNHSFEITETEKQVTDTESLVSSPAASESGAVSSCTAISEVDKSTSTESQTSSSKPGYPDIQFLMCNPLPEWYTDDNIDPERRKQLEKIVDLVATDFENTSAYKYLKDRLDHNSELIDCLLVANGVRDDCIGEVGFLDYAYSVDRLTPELMTDETLRELTEPDCDLSARNPFAVWAPDELEHSEPAAANPVQDVANTLMAKSGASIHPVPSVNSSEVLSSSQNNAAVFIPPALAPPPLIQQPIHNQQVSTIQPSGQLCNSVESSAALVTSTATIVSALPQVFASRCDSSNSVVANLVPTTSAVIIKSEPSNSTSQQASSLVSVTNTSIVPVSQLSQLDENAVVMSDQTSQEAEQTTITSSLQSRDLSDQNSLSRHCTELIKFSMRQYRQSWLRKGASGCQRIEDDQHNTPVTSPFNTLICALEKKLHRETVDFGCQMTQSSYASMDIPPNRSANEIPIPARNTMPSEIVGSNGRSESHLVHNPNPHLTFSQNAMCNQNSSSQSQHLVQQAENLQSGTPIASQIRGNSASPYPTHTEHPRPPPEPTNVPHPAVQSNNRTNYNAQSFAVVLKSSPGNASVNGTSSLSPSNLSSRAVSNILKRGRGRPSRSLVETQSNGPKRLPTLGVRPKVANCANSNVQVNANNNVPLSSANSPYLVVPLNGAPSQSISPMYQLVTTAHTNTGPSVDGNNTLPQGVTNQRQAPDNNQLYRERMSVQSPRRLEASSNRIPNASHNSDSSANAMQSHKTQSVSNQNRPVQLANQNRPVQVANQNRPVQLANQNRSVQLTNHNQSPPPRTNQSQVIDLVSDDDDDSESSVSTCSNASSQRFLPQNNSHLLLNPSNSYRNSLMKQKQQRRKRCRVNRTDVLLPVTTEMEKMSSSVEAASHDLPPKLLLSASPTENNNNTHNNTGSSRGITLIWKMHIPKQTNCKIKKYELMANTGGSVNANSSDSSGWVLVDSIAPLVLPMQCSLTNLNPGVIHFAIRGIDVFKRAGDYSNVVTVSIPKQVFNQSSK